MDEPMDRIADLIEFAHRKGIRIWSEGGQLRYKAPAGSLTQHDLERFRLSRDNLLAFLHASASAGLDGPPQELGTRLDHAPLSFSQLAHWYLYRLGERPSVCHVWSATRLHGRLNVDAIRRSIAEIVVRHEALRTRIVVKDGTPTQEMLESCDYELEITDLSGVLDSAREVHLGRLVARATQKPIDVSVAPLFRAQMVRLKPDEHVLVFIMEHIISDGFSTNVLLRDLFTTYVQIIRGRPSELSKRPFQFADFAVGQRNGHKSWIREHGAFWEEYLKGCRRLRFPSDRSVAADVCVGWANVPFRISRDLTADFREWCRRRRTTLVMGALTAYIALVLRWCNSSEGVFLYETSGRMNPRFEGAIGYFASPLYLRVKRCDEDSLGDLVNRVTEEYCRAYTHADFSYMEAQLPRPEFTRSTCFNWLPQEVMHDLADLQGSQDKITFSRFPFEQPILPSMERDVEPIIVLLETDDLIDGWVQFPLNRFSTALIERLTRNFVSAISVFLIQPERRVKDLQLVE